MLKNKMNNQSKYKAIKCESEGIKFPSQLERNCYLVLQQLKKDEKIDFFLRQIPFDLPGNFIHRVDFAVFSDSNGATFIEAKGKDIAIGKMKRLQVEEIYKIKIEVVKDAFEIYLLIG